MIRTKAKSVIHRYSLRLVDGPQKFIMPADATIVSVGVKPNDACVSLWAIHRTEEPSDPATRTFVVRVTGHEVGEGLTFVGSAIDQYMGTSLVWHVFEVEGRKP